ncbi:MAG: hypothetical protein LIO86_08980, partial [Lachnospiraceae bacterium]|nr:hypothetical protein [Lachnospiraceae bacterium]
NRVTATATITGKGNFTGTTEVTYKVYYSKVSLTNLRTVATSTSGITTTLNDKADELPKLLVTIEDAGLTFNNAAQKPLSVTVKIQTDENTTETLTLNKDYTLSYSNNKNAGSSAKIKITGKGSFSGSATVYFNIDPASLADASIYVASPTKNVKASSLSSTGKLVLNGKTVTLKKGTAYTLEAVESNTDGYYAVKAVAKSSNYTDETTAYLYKVGKVSMTDEASRFTVEFADGYSDSYEYTGSAIKPKLVVTDTVYDRVLVSGTDYTLSYKNNTNAGTATITIKGKTHYSGSLHKTFTITAKNISDEDMTIALADVKKGQKVAYKSLVTLKNGSKKLTYNSNYTITSSVANGSKGDGNDFTITINAKGTNYTGTKKVTIHGYLYAISSRVKVTVSPAYYTGTQLTPDFVVYDSVTGEILTSTGEDASYTYEYGENVKVGTKSGTIVLTGIGEYGGTAKTVRFAIRAKSIYDVLNSMFGLEL